MFRANRRTIALVGAFMVLTAPCLPAAAQTLKPVRILTTWFAQADQAGFWQAQEEKLGHDAGINITVLQGGPKIQTIPQVASGQAEFGIGNADDVLVARMRGAPVKAVFAALNWVPFTLAYHADPAVKTIADLQGRTIAVSLGFAYWEWTKKHFNLRGMREIPVTGDLSLFRNDPRMVQQGFSLYLPARMEGAGIPVQQFKVPDLGYRPYYVLFTTDEMIKNNPALVKTMVAAARQGWVDFVRNPSKIKPLLMSLNQQIPPDVHDAAVKEMTETLIPRDTSKVGCMTDARWKELADQLRDVKFLPPDFDEKQGYDLNFLPGC